MKKRSKGRATRIHERKVGKGITHTRKKTETFEKPDPCPMVPKRGGRVTECAREKPKKRTEPCGVRNKENEGGGYKSVGKRRDLPACRKKKKPLGVFDEDVEVQRKVRKEEKDFSTNVLGLQQPGNSAPTF